jgi:hypothetical protein
MIGYKILFGTWFIWILIPVLFIAFTLSAEGATLNVTVNDINGSPAGGVVFQIFSGNPDIDDNILPTKLGDPASDKRDNDGDGQIDESGEDFAGYATGADGKLQLDLKEGPYTIVGFSQTKHFLFVRRMSVPGSVVINASEAVPVSISCRTKDDTPISTAEIFFRPTKRARASVGYSNNQGLIKAYVSEGEYNVVLWSAFGLGSHYLILPHYTISRPEDKVSLHVSELSTAELHFDVPKGTAIAMFEVLDSSYTTEYSEGLEPEIGYDAAYTDFYPLISSESKFTLSANVDYNFNMSFAVLFGDGIIHAYEIRPSLHQITPGAYQVGATENSKFNLQAGSIRGDKDPVYHPGEEVQLYYNFTDSKRNTLSRILNFTGARLILPMVTIRDPNGAPIINNFDTIEFSNFNFTLPVTAIAGEYKADISLEAGMYGDITGTFRFYVQPAIDNEPPVIESSDIPDQIEAGVELNVMAKITDNSNSIAGKPLIRISNDSGASWTEIQISSSGKDSYGVSIPSNLIVPGNLDWQIVAQDASGNKGIRSGTVKVIDTKPPVIIHKIISKAELGLKFTVEADVSDNSGVKEATLFYVLPDGSNKSVKMSKINDGTYVAYIDGSEVSLNGLKYYISAVDTFGNKAFIPSESGSPKFTQVVTEDTVPPIISHNPIQVAVANSPVRIEAIITDNSGQVDAALFHKNSLTQNYQSIKMDKQAGIFVGEIPPSAVTTGSLKYHISAKDAPDPAGKTRSSINPATGDYTVEVIPAQQGAITRLEITPSASQDDPLKVKVGESLKFSAIGRTETNNPMPVDVAWLTTDGIGYIDQGGAFLSSGRIAGNGKGRIMAVVINVSGTSSESPITAEAWVQIVPEASVSMTLNPGSIVISAGDQHRFFATTRDMYSNQVESEIKWRLDSADGIGKIGDSTGTSSVLQFSKVGKGKLIAELNGISAVSDITVVPGNLKRIAIDTGKIKPPLVATAGNNMQFTATGYDAYDNLIPITPVWSVRGNIGNIRSDGVFTGWTAGNGQIVSTVGDASATIDVEVVPGNLYKISVSPYTAYVPVSKEDFKSTYQFTATGRDIAGNFVTLQSISWRTDALAGKITPTGLLTINLDPGVHIGEVVFNATVYAAGVSVSGSRLEGAGYVVIQRQPTSRLSSVKVIVQGTSGGISRVDAVTGDIVQFEAFGTDNENRNISLSPSWSVTGGIGTVDVNGRFTATKPGIGTIIATSGGFTGQMDIMVRPSFARYIKIKPDFLFLSPGAKASVSVVGYDSYENVVQLDNVQWAVEGNSVTIKPTGNSCSIEYNPTPNGVETTNTVSAKIGDFTAFTNVFIPVSKAELVPSFTVKTDNVPYYLEVNHDLISVMTGTKHQFTAKAIDVLGNVIDTNTLSWSVTSGIGEIDGSGLFSASSTDNKQSIGRVIVTDGRIFGSAIVTVIPAMPTFTDLIVVPSKVAVSAGEIQKFIALMKSSDDKGVTYTLPTGVSAWRVIGNNGSVDSSGKFMATIVGDGVVEASIAGLSARSDVAVSMGIPVSIEIQPGTLSVKSGDQQKLKIVSKDDAGNTKQYDPSSYLFQIPGGLGVIDQSGVFTAQKVGAGYIMSSTLSGLMLFSKVDIRVISGDIKDVKLTPVDQKVTSGSFVRFFAVGKDTNGNLIPVNPVWELSGTSEIGTISTDGLFIADKVGDGKVIARVGDRSASVNIEVMPGTPTFILVEPSLISIYSQSAEKRQFRAIFKDLRGNVIDSVSYTSLRWSVTEELGTVEPTTGLFVNKTGLSEPRTGYVNVTAVFNPGTVKEKTILGRAAVVLQTTPKPLASITITPNPVSVIKGDFQKFTVTGKNSDGLEMEVLPQWRVVSSDGSTEIQGAISADGVFSSTPEMKIGSNWKVLASATNSAGKIIQGESVISIIAGIMQSIEVVCKGDACSKPIESGKVVELTAMGYDKFRNTIDISPNWKMVGQIGTVKGSNNKATFTAGLAGVGEVVAEASGKEGKVHVTVINGQLTRISILTDPVQSDEKIGSGEANPLIIKSGSNIALNAVGFDSDVDELGNPKPINTISISPEWSLKETNLGTIYSDGRFTAKESGNGSINAKVGSVTASFYIKVIPGSLASIKVSPPSISLASGKDREQQFTASGYDQYGNQIPDFQPKWEIAGEIGSINENGVLTTVVLPSGATAISGTVIASQNGIEGSAMVTIVIVLGELSRLIVTIEPSIVQAGGKATCIVKGFDESGFSIVKFSDTLKLSVPASLGSLTLSDTPNTWTFRAVEHLPLDERKGSLIVSVESNGKVLSAETSFSLVPASLDRIAVDPATFSISAGEERRFKAYGYDAYGNLVELTSPEWTLLGGIGKATKDAERPQECVFSANIAGDGQLIAGSQGHEGKAELKVLPGQVETIDLQPESLVIESGTSHNFTVIAKDSYGNPVADPKLQWQVNAEIGSITGDGIFSAIKAGNGLIKVVLEADKSISDESSVTVVPGAIASANIVVEYNGTKLNPPYTLLSGDQYSLHVKGFDSQGNEILQLKEIVWKIAEDKGLITPSQSDTSQANLTALFPGAGDLSVAVGKVSVSSGINVVPYTQKIDSRNQTIIQGPLGAQMDISPKALRNGETISVSLLQSSGAIQNAKRIGYVYRFEPEGTIFSIPAKLTLSYDYVNIPVDDEKLSIYFWDKFQKKWIRAGGVVDMEQKTVTAYVNFLSQFAIMQEETEPQEVKDSNYLEVNLSPNAYFALEVNRLTIHYNVGWKNHEMVGVTIDIYDIRGNLVRELINKNPRYPGWNSDQWDGTDESGKMVKNGRYFVVVTAETDSDKVSKVKHLAIFQ